ncbi:MAG: GAF domain-containing protein [Planctomycetes bacterium]|nr:GAF domain-containing protein [Planctomycetota bacterium]
MERQEFGPALYIYLIVCTTAFIEFILADVLADQSFPFDTERKLALMEKSLGASVISTISTRIQQTIQQFPGCDQSRIKGAVHLMAELTSTADKRIREGLLQLTDYVGAEGEASLRKKGRVTLINQGVIGRCARTGQLESADFADAAEYHSAMVREFGFTKEEADGHTQEARSYLAYPLKYDGCLVGVLYFFTTEPQVFPRAADQTQLEDVAQEMINYLRLAKLV